MKKYLIPLVVAVFGATFLTSCNSNDYVVEAPVILWNRQPTDASNNVDTDIMTDSRFENIYYVGFDATQGGVAQGKMIVDFLEDQAERDTAWWKRVSADGKLTYGLLIGQIDHNDSAARTAGIRDALNTRTSNPTTNANNENPQVGTLTINGTEITIEEVAHQEAKSTAGVTWDATTANTIVTAWYNDENVSPEFIVSNNDGMAEAALTALEAMSQVNYFVPIWGYDSNDANVGYIHEYKTEVATIDESTTELSGAYQVGTINQNATAQAAGIFMLARNLIDGVENPTTSGFNGNEGNYGTIPESSPFTYDKTNRALLVDNFAVTADNVDDYYGTSVTDLAFDTIKNGGGETANIFLNIYSNSDTFLNASMVPLFNAYATDFNFSYSVVNGDGNSDNSVVDRITTKCDAYIVNLVKTTNALTYLDRIYSCDQA